MGDISWGLQCPKLTPPPLSPPDGMLVHGTFLQLIYINYLNVYVYVACTHLN